MEKLDSIRMGQIWLTVFKTDNGEIVITFCKSYPTTQGWKTTNFLRPEAGDVKKLSAALQIFQEAYNKGEGLPLVFRRITKTIAGESI